MMKLVAAVLALTCAAAAQGGATVRWKSGDSEQWINGELQRELARSGATVRISLKDTGSFFRVLAVISNRTPGPLNVFPDSFTLTGTGKSPKQYTALLLPELIQKRSGWGTVAAAAAGGMRGYSQAVQRRTGSATVYNPNGTISRVDIYQTGPTQQGQ